MKQQIHKRTHKTCKWFEEDINSISTILSAFSMEECELQKLCQSLKQDIHKKKVKMHEVELQFAKMC